jgi:chloramphenicol-sensitive protein RarD
MSDDAPHSQLSARNAGLAGVLFGIAAYGWWGFVAVYFKIVREVPPLEILAHRIIWSVVMLVLIVTFWRRWSAFGAVFRAPRTLAFLLGSTLLIALNWYVFIWAITRDHMVDASLGYFINPLVNVVLGFLFFGERLRRLERVSVALAGIAVLWLIVGAGVFPWISLTLAVSFGLYGLVRKLAQVASIEGLTIETVILLPFALAYLVHLETAGHLVFANQSLSMDALLVAAGPVTALPLIWFASAVRRLRLATIGLLQYIAPSIQFTLAVTIYREPFDRARLLAFILIWSAIAIYSFDNFRRRSA